MGQKKLDKPIRGTNSHRNYNLQATLIQMQ